MGLVSSLEKVATKGLGQAKSFGGGFKGARAGQMKFAGMSAGAEKFGAHVGTHPKAYGAGAAVLGVGALHRRSQHQGIAYK